MPFHLWPDQSNRRDFLGVLVASGTAIALSQKSLLADDDGDDPWVAFVSDTHIAADPRREVRGQVMAANLGAVMASILKSPRKASAVVIDGDLALLDGQLADYDTFLTLLEPIRNAGIPIHLTLGNHDDRNRFRQSIAGRIPAESRLESKHVGAFEAAGHWFILLDSLQATNVTPGVLGRSQLEWLAGNLDVHRERSTIIFVHHNPNAVGGTGLIDDAALLAIIRGRPWVKALVYGHTHTWTRSEEKGLHLLNLPAVGYPFAGDQPIGYAQFRPSKTGAILTLKAIGADRSKNGESWQLAWR